MSASAPERRTIPGDASFQVRQARDGWPLRRFDWPVSEGAGRGSILFQGGRGDFVEKYLEAYAHWHAEGWHVTAFDWRGQGGSGRASDDPHCGHIGSFDSYMRDLYYFFGEWREAAPGPHVAMGHSMGGHLILRALVEGAIRPDAAVLIAPMLGLKTPFGAWLGERVARFLGGIGDAARPAWKANEKPGTTATREALLTHDHTRYTDELWWQEAKPELSLGPPSWRWLIEAFRSTRVLRERKTYARMDVPLLTLIAEADELVDPKVAAATVARLPDSRVVRFGPESAHEILRETDSVRNRALGEIDLFLSARLPA